jgi:Uma2 family endonuclease
MLPRLVISVCYASMVGSSLVEQIVSGEAPPLVPLTTDQYHTMLERGILRDGDPVELVEGLLVRKNRGAVGGPETTHGPRHALIVKRLTRLERALEALGCHLLVQLPITLSAVDEPEPDLAIVKGSPEAYADRHPGPQDVLVVVEVADSSLRYDRGTKQRVYAVAGVPAYVIVNIPDERVELYEEPVAGEGRYRRRTDHVVGEALTLSLADARVLSLPVADVFGPR